MSHDSDETDISLRDVVRAVGKYPEEAYRFVRDGLEFSARAEHGSMTPPQYLVAQYMQDESLDIEEVIERLEDGTIDPVIAAAVSQAGGLERLNRNVGGSCLCWALRDLALIQWGRLAIRVLENWQIRKTDDFGEIVFALVDHGFMHKEPHDSIEDFHDVYDFESALVKSFHLTTREAVPG